MNLPDLLFSPSDDVAVLLNSLLDSYERRGRSSPNGSTTSGMLSEGVGACPEQSRRGEGRTRLIHCSLPELDLPTYFSQIDPNPRRIANDQLQTLADRGWLDLEWQPGGTGHLLEQVALHPDFASHIFKLLNRTPAAVNRDQIADLILGERFRFQNGWRLRAIHHILNQLETGKSPAPFSLTDQEFNQDLLIALDGLDSVTAETPYRVFSVRLFNNSKRFEEIKQAIVRLARLGQREWHGLAPQDVLRELNLVPNPDYIYLSGPWQLVDDLGQVISLGEFSPSVGIPAAQAALLQRVTVHSSQVICVENPTSFHELIRNRQPGTIAALCLWGNPSPACRHLLSRMAENLPESIPLKVWADLDYGGFNILAMLRKHVSPRFEPFLMDVETLENHVLWAHPLNGHDELNLKRLSKHPLLADVKSVISHMLDRNIKLEQEAVGIQIGKKLWDNRHHLSIQECKMSKSITPIRPKWDGTMTDRERFNAQMHYQPVDRCFNMEFGYWDENFTQWPIFYENEITNNTEADVFFNFDRQFTIGGNIWLSPAFAEEIVEIRENTQVIINQDGLLAEVPLDGHDTIPHFIKSSIVTPDDWGKVKAERFRLDDPTRIVDVAALKSRRDSPDRDYPLGIWVGSMIGKVRDLLTFEGLAYAIYDYPAMVEDMVETACVMVEQALDQILPHFEFDFAAGWEDICYKAGPIVSPKWFRRVITPRYQRIHKKLQAHGIDIWWIDCDGDVRPILDAMMEGGVNCLFPYEVNGCSHPAELLKSYGKDLRIMGGFDKIELGKGREAIKAYMETLGPLVERGGFIPFCDHRCPPNVDPDDYLYYLDLKEQMFGEIR